MKNKKTYMAILLGLLVGAGSSVFADQVTLNASADATALGADPTGNYGSLTFGRIRHQAFVQGQDHIMTKFDLSALPALGAGQSFQINYARMRFFVALNGDAGWPAGSSFPQVSIYNNTQDWVESTVTSDTAPTRELTAANTISGFGLEGVNYDPFTAPDTITDGDGGDRWLEFDDAGTWALVEAWANGSTSNFGVSLEANGAFTDDGRWFDVQSREQSFAGVRPTLIVDYTIIPEPATLGMFGMIGAAMLIVRRKFMI